MPKTQTSCPRCRQPVIVEAEQLFDMNVDPQAKQRLLSGQSNTIRCQNCGYEGMLSTPVVYHDPAKELLLTYFPPELGLPVNEQEKLIGPLINQVVNKLPAEKRKAYLLRPQAMLTYQTMVEKILEADGVTKEMLDEQQKRLNLIQRLLTTVSAESRLEMIKQEAGLVDASLFSMINRLFEATMAQGDQQSGRMLATLQQELLQNTDFGRELQAQAGEADAAVKTLQEASKNGLTREKLLDILIGAPNDIQLSTMVGMVRQGLDYEFFQILTGRIDAASNADEKAKLTGLREKLLQMTKQIDQEMQRQVNDMRQFLNELLAQPDIEKATQENLGAVNELFVELLRAELQAAREKSDLERLAKLQKVSNVIEKASAPPPEYQLIEDLISAEDDAGRRQVLEKNSDRVTQEFIDLLANLALQSEQQEQDAEVVRQLKDAYRSALRYSMEKNMKQ